MIACWLHDEEIYICSKAEARHLWDHEKEKRDRIWLESEIELCLLFDAEQLRPIVEAKKQRKGYVFQ